VEDYKMKYQKGFNQKNKSQRRKRIS